MIHIKIAIILVSILAFVASATGCNTLAISGSKKYKVDLQNHLLAITMEIEKEGIVSDRTMGRFEKFMSKNESEYGAKGSWIRADDALKELKLANADPDGPFQHNNTAKYLILQCQDLLMTEVKE